MEQITKVALHRNTTPATYPAAEVLVQQIQKVETYHDQPGLRDDCRTSVPHIADSQQ